MFSVSLLASVLSLGALGGCSLLDKATADRPNSTQAHAVGDVFDNMATVGGVMADPAGSNDTDMGEMFQTQAYYDLLDPAGTAARRARSGGSFDPTCVDTTGSIAAWDCDVAYAGGTCNVSGSGAESPANHYAGTATLDAAGEGSPCIFPITLTGAFDLDVEEGVGGSGAGTFNIAQTGEQAFGFDVTLDGIHFCANGAPDAGTLTVDGTGAADGLPFDPISILFSSESGECGVMEIL